MNRSGFSTRLFETYRQAVQAGQLVFTPSTVVKIETETTTAGYGSLDMIIRHAPQLGKKDDLKEKKGQRSEGHEGGRSEGHEGGRSDGHEGRPQEDPFMPPYPASLHLGSWGSGHQLLLNKFAICPAHFLVISNANEPQSQPLYRDDLVATWRAMQGANEGKDVHGVLGFYNSGPESGASQAHKHVQVIPFTNESPSPPVADWVARAKGLPDGKVYTIDLLPFANYTVDLDGIDNDDLDDTDLGDRLVTSFHACLDHVIDRFRQAQGSAPRLSYNVLLYLSRAQSGPPRERPKTPFMMLIPRRKERPEKCPSASINAMGFAGMVLAKSDQDLETFRHWNNVDPERPSKLMELLAELGFEHETVSSEE